MDKELANGSLDSLDSSTDNLEMASSTKPVDTYVPANTNSAYVEFRDKDAQANNSNQLEPKKSFLKKISNRSTMIISAVVLTIVLLISGISALLVTRNQGNDGSSKLVPSQNLDIESDSLSSESEIFSGKEKALLVNGDIITRGSLTVTNGSYIGVLKSEGLSSSQEYLLPNASGTICLNTNNCGFATADQLSSLQSQLGQIVIPSIPEIPASSLVNNQSGSVSIQGASNRISVSTNNGVISISTPQDIGLLSSPTFANLILSGNFSLGGILDLPLNCSINANGGSLTTNASGQVICSDDDNAGGAGTVSSPGGTAGYIPIFTAAQTIADSIISQALGVVSVGGDLSLSGDLTLGSLSNGFLSVNGSGLVSVNTIDLGIDTSGDYVLGVSAGNGLSIGGVAGEGWTPTVSLALQANKGLEVDGSGLSLIDCANGELLKYNGSNQWACAVDIDTDTTGSFTLAGTSGTPETVNNGDTVTIAAGNNVTTTAGATDTVTIATVNNPNFSTSVTTPLLQSSGALSITPGGALTVGSTGQTALLQGTNVTITSNGAGNDIILTSADQIRFSGFDCSALANGGKLTTDASGNISCAADSGASGSAITGSGTANRIALYTGSQVIADSWLLQNGSTLELDNTRDLSLLGGNFSVTGTGLFSGLISANGGLTLGAAQSLTVNGDAFTDLTGTGLSISSGSLQTTLGTSVDLTSEVTGTLPVTSGGTGLASTPTNGQLLIGNGTGYSLATITQGAGITVTNGVGSITVASSLGGTIELGTETTGDYVANVTAGNGLTGSASGAGSTPTLALGQLTSDWNQTGAFDIVLNNAGSELRILESAGATFYGSLDVGDLTANRTYTLPDATGTICLDTGNCAGSGGGVTTAGGTNNTLAKFNGAQTIADSTITDDGSTVTTSVDLVVQGGSATIGTTLQDGALTLYSSGQSALIQASLGSSDRTYTLPDGDGEFCIKELGNCSGGSGGNAPTGAEYLTLSTDGTLTAERVLTFNGTNFSVTDGGANGSYTVNTIQNIATTSAPTFAGLTLNGNLNLGSNTLQGTTAVIDFTNFDVASNGNVTAGTYNGQTISSSASFTGTLTAAGLLTANGGVTLGAAQSLTVNGDAFTDLTGNGLQVSANTLTIATQANKGLEVDGNGLSLIDCANGEILKYNGSNQWACANDVDTDTTYTAGNGLDLTGTTFSVDSPTCAGTDKLTWNGTAFVCAADVDTDTGDEVAVNGAATSGANFIDTAASGTNVATTWTLDNLANPDEITLSLGAASGTDAGIITANAQTIGGSKTFNGQIVAGAGINLGAQTLQGTTAVIDFNNFDVSSAGAITAVGVNAGSGLIQGTGGITASGTITLSSLTNGFLEVNGSGVVSVGTIDLGTDTNGNYVATITPGNGISGTSNSEGGTPTIALSNLTSSWLQSGAFDITLDNASSELNIRGSGGAFYAVLDVAGITSDQTFTFNEGGTVVTSGNVSSHATTGVTAGAGLTGGGTTGVLTVDIGAGNGVTVNANDITLALQANKGLEVDGSGLSLIDCSNGELLKYNGSNQWACSSDIDTDTGVTTVGAIDSQTKSANGAVISGTSIYLQTADISNPGLVSTGTQTFAGNKTFNNDVEIFGSSINLGNNALDTITATANLRAGNSATATTGTTSGTGTNTTTLTLTADAFAIGDVVLIDNAGQDYYTRITADPGTGSYTVSPAVTFENGVTVTKYNVQNVGATATDYSTLSDRFFQGYFLGGVVTGAGSTTLSDGRLHSTGTLNLNASSVLVQNTADSTAAFQIQNAAGTSNLLVADTTNTRIGIGATPANGLLTVGTNTTTAAGGIYFGTDTNLYRSAANILTTDDSMDIGGQVLVRQGGGSKTALYLTSVAFNTGITIGGDTNLYRSAADTWTTDDSLTVTGLLTANGNLTIQNGDTFTVGGDAFTDLTGDGLTVSSNALTVDTTSATGFFRNGGNSFSGAATLGTNDANVLNLETGGTNRFQVSASASTLTGQGSTTIGSTGTLSLSSATGSNLNVTAGTTGTLNLDTGTTGSIFIGTGANAKQIQIGNNSGATGIGLYGGTSGVSVSTIGDFSVVAAGDMTSLMNSAIFTSQNDSATAFQVQNSLAASLLNVNATTGLVTVDNDLAVGGDATVTGLLTANGNLTIQNGDTFTVGGDAFTDLTGSGLIVSSNALTVDDSTATGFFRNGGNSFSGAATLGTNDANVLNFETGGTNRFQIASGGAYLTGQGNTRVDSTGGSLYVGSFGTLGGSSGIGIGTTAITFNAINIGDSGGNTVNIRGGGINIGASGAANTIQIGNITGAVSQTINIGNNSTASSTNNVNIGSSIAGTTAITGTTTVTGRTSGSSTALNVNNSTSTGNIFVAQDNGTAVMTIADGGAALLQNSANSTSAFQVQNASSDQLFNINTSTTPNLLSNPSLEVNTTGWAAKGSATITRDTTQSYVGNASLKIATTATTNDGANYPYSLTSSTTYTLSFYAKLDSGSAALSTMIVGWSNDGSTDSNCLAVQTVIATGWTRYTCTFTTGTTSGSPYIFIKQSGATARTWYVDSVQLQTGTIGTNIIANPGFEVDTSSWTAYSSAGISRTTSEFNSGVASLQIDSSSIDAGNEGALYYLNNLTPNTQYTFRLYAKLGAGMPATSFGVRYHTGSGEVNCSGSTPTVNSSSWTLWQCSFQSGAAPSSSSYVAFIQTTNLDQVITSYIDDVSVSANIYSPFTLGQMSLNGVVVSPLVLQNSADSRTAFQIQNAAGTSNLLVADTINSRIAIGQPVANYTLDVGGDINTSSAYKIRGTDICTSSGCTVLSSSGIRNQSFTQSSANFNIQSSADGTITGALTARASQTADLLRAQNSSSVKLLSIGADGSITGNAASTATTATTSGTGTNTTTVTLSGSAFADNDVIFIDNAGQDYYTRIVSGGGTATLTVSPAVTFETARTVTKYNVQNIGATSTNYTSNANRLFQGYFLGGVVVGAGTTTLSDGRLTSTGTMNINSSSVDIRNTADSTTALRVQNAAGTSLLSADTTNMRISIGSTGTPTGQLYVSGTSPTTNLGSIAAGDGGGIVKIQGKYAYTIGYNDGQLHVIDISAPASPVVVGSVFAPTNVSGLEVKGKYAYAIDLADGLVIFDISNPFSPTVLTTVSVTALGGSGIYDEGFVINGNYLYMVDIGSIPTNFVIIDITNPTNPLVKSVDVPYEDGGSMLSARIYGKYMYVADYYLGQLLIYDMSDPLNPVQISSTSVSGVLMDVFPVGRYVYVLRDVGTDAIIAYDVSDPANPIVAGSLATGSYNPKKIHIQGRYAYVIFQSNRLGIYDISNPASITQVSLLNGGGLSVPNGLSVQGRYAYIANSSNDTFVTYDLGGAYIQQLEAGGIETTTLSVSNDTFIGGDLTLQGGLSVQGNSQFTGNVGVLGQARFQSATDSTTAFQIQNASGNQIISVDTTTNNLITNPSFEGADTVWQNGSRSTAERYIGEYSYAVPTFGSSIYAWQEVPSLASSTTYKLTFYVKDGSGDYDTFNSMIAGYNEDGSDVNCMSSQTVSAFGWTRFSCTFTTTTVSSPNPYIYIGQSSSDSRIFYVDGVQLTAINEPANLVTNPDFESGATDWSSYSTGSVTQSSVQAHQGTYSLRITTGSTTQAGSTHTGYTSYTPDTQYTIKGYARLDSASAPSQDLYAFGHTVDFGQSATSNVGCSRDILSSTEWKLFTCTFTTASSLRASPYITFTRFSGGTASSIVYLDSVQMYEGPDVGDNNPQFNQAKISLNGVIDSPAVFKGNSNSTTAFIIQGANAGHSLFVADTVNNRIAIGKNTASYTLDVEGTINATTSVISPLFTSAAGTALSVDSGTTAALNVGTGANAKTITIGNATGATSVVVNCGTGACSFGANATAHTTTVGSVSGAATTTIQGGTGGVNLGTGGIANTIQIGNTTGAVSQTINIGNNATASSTNTVIIGSTIGTSSVTLQGGSGGVNIGTSSGTTPIQIGNINTASTQTIGIGNANVAGATRNITIGSTIAGTTAIQGATTITNRTSGSEDTLIVGNSTSTGSIFLARDNTTAVMTIADGGATTFQNQTNSTAGFQIQNAAGSSNLFVADTTNTRIGVGAAPANSLLSIGTNTTTAAGGVTFGTDTNLYRYAQDVLATDGSFFANGGNFFATTAYTGLSFSSATNSGIYNTGADGTGIIAIDNGTAGVPVVGIAQGGATTFRNNSDSTAAFQIQNSSSTPLLVADTSNSRLYVGNPTADATGAILVLDTKNTSGDPTGVDGAMYYNSDSKSFRCYSNGSWRSCVGGVVFANTSLPGGNTVNNTAAETNFASNYTIPANECQPGRVYKITAQGVWGQDADATVQMKVKMGSTVIGQTNNNSTNAAGTETNRQWKVEYDIICQTAGASGTVEGQGILTAFYNDDITTSQWEMKNTAAVTIDTTTSQTLQMSIDWGTAHTNNTFTLRQFIVEASGP